MLNIIRTCRFSPYRKGAGPTFTLKLWDTGRVDWRKQSELGYSLTLKNTERSMLLFMGEDFAGSPMHADDSDATVLALMNFLCLRPGDTDKEYFENYTEDQHWFARQHAEALLFECMRRFEKEES